ncbi:Neuferricin [Frankliniella fusca]|uniref:Neuferricin n=1 Tax=Frankliniella fusca TaxID=407009 RepID=A0AAE1LT19_9NEOP|nr:Neuferricin [Frankliniella fusca]
MALKAVSIGIVVIAVIVMYLHEYHHDKISQINDIPFVKKYLIKAHDLIIDVSRTLSSSKVDKGSLTDSERLFTVNELAEYNGEDGSSSIYLAVLGKVFDVSRGRKHYGPGGSYHAFAGRDASRAFFTGDFSENGITDDVSGLSPDDLKSIQDWSLFYNKEYTYKGKLIGRYFNANGEMTDYFKEVKTLIKQAEEKNAAQNAEYLKFPPCNVEWTPESGSRVWCSNRSGGIERDWAGVPRKYYKPGSESYRCTCIKYADEMKIVPRDQRKGNIEEYDGCEFDSNSCYVKD